MSSLHHSPRHGLYRSRTDVSSQTSRRPAPNRSATYHGEKEQLPWEHMTRTYEWVLRHEYNMFDNRERKTEQWIKEQDIFRTAQSGTSRIARIPGRQERLWEDEVYFNEMQAKRKMRHEETASQKVAGSEMRARHFEEETERIEVRIRYKLETERRKLAEEKRRAYEEMKSRERRNKQRMEKFVLEAWNEYEESWNKLMSSSKLLMFSSIPWPVLTKPTKEEEIEPGAIASFLLSPSHSVGQTRKERIRSAQLRWHPDRFQRVLGRVKEEEKVTVEKCVGIVARCLNELNIVT